jgi:hypothetical protein
MTIDTDQVTIAFIGFGVGLLIWVVLKLMSMNNDKNS